MASFYDKLMAFLATTIFVTPQRFEVSQSAPWEIRFYELTDDEFDGLIAVAAANNLSRGEKYNPERDFKTNAMRVDFPNLSDSEATGVVSLVGKQFAPKVWRPK